MKSHRLILLALVCTFPGLLTATPTQEPGATVRQPELYLYEAPPGWRVFTLPGIRNPVASDAMEKDFHPYIQVDTQFTTTSLAEFTAANKVSLKAMVPSAEFIEEAPFETTAGARGVRIVVKSHVGKNDLQATYYLFEGTKNIKFVVIANGLASQFEKTAPLFDAAMKTFEPK